MNEKEIMQLIKQAIELKRDGMRLQAKLEVLEQIPIDRLTDDEKSILLIAELTLIHMHKAYQEILEKIKNE